MMVTYTVHGTAYPLALTLGAMEGLDSLCGGIEHIDTAFDGKGTMQILSIAINMLAVLLRGGYDYLREQGEEAVKPPSREALMVSLFPRDIKGARTAIYQAIAEGMGRTVDVEADGKNAGATQGG